MGLIGGIWMTVLGILGASNLIIAKKPDAAQLIAKVAPYQGWIGAVSAIWGVWGVIWAVLNLRLLSLFPVWWLTIVAVGVLQFALGLLLGVGVIKQFVKQPQAVQKMDQMIAKLAPKQGVLGVIAIFVGIWLVAANFLWTVA